MLRFAQQLRNNNSDVNYPVNADRGNFKIHHRIRADFNYSGLRFTRNFGAAQEYTYVGTLNPVIVGGSSSLAGIDRKLLTTDGSVNVENVISTLRTNNGVTAQNAYAHGVNITNWKWEDNHVTLLINMLRAHQLKKLEECSTMGKGGLREYNDGHVRIAAWGDTEASSKFVFEWPCKQDVDEMPDWAQYAEAFPNIDIPYIDLRGNTAAEAEFILMMTCGWKSSSNYISDFDLPRLTDRLAYRSFYPLTRPDQWVSGELSDEDFPTPPSKVIWSAFRKYVVQNKLYNQAFTAMYLFAQFSVRPVGNSAEGMLWTRAEPTLVLPKFKSVRGRYPFLLDGEGALIQAGALDDWNQAIRSDDSLNTASVILSTLLNVGLYSRLFRGVVDGSGVDDNYDFSLFLKPETFVASSLAYASGIEAPLKGMDGAFLYYPQFTERDCINYIYATVFQSAGYDYEVGLGLKVLGVPLASSPYCVYPLAIFDSANPFSGAFTIPVADEYLRTGAIYKVRDAWNYAWAARIAGYDLKTKFTGDETGLDKFYAHNADSWCHIPYAVLDPEVRDVIVRQVAPRRHHFVDLPNNTRKAFAQEISVQITITDSYFEGNGGVVVRDMAGSNRVTLPTSTGLQVISSGEALRYWGAVRRNNEGLTMSDTIRPAVVPDLAQSIGNIDLSNVGEVQSEELV
ncbi:capsid protein [Pichia membranifaciens virus L-A]|nr:capsid protein [Pichia membranifaciens virus L-A]